MVGLWDVVGMSDALLNDIEARVEVDSDGFVDIVDVGDWVDLVGEKYGMRQCAMQWEAEVEYEVG